MITQETAAQIWKCYQEIEKSHNLLSYMEDAMNKGTDPTPRDLFGKTAPLKLGVPSGENCHQLFDVQPRLALSVIRAHIADQEAKLVAANEQARIEIETPISASGEMVIVNARP